MFLGFRCLLTRQGRRLGVGTKGNPFLCAILTNGHIGWELPGHDHCFDQLEVEGAAHLSLMGDVVTRSLLRCFESGHFLFLEFQYESAGKIVNTRSFYPVELLFRRPWELKFPEIQATPKWARAWPRPGGP